MKLNIYNKEGEIKGSKEVSGDIFAVKVKPALINEAVTAQLANQRQVLAHTKTRSEVRGGGRKPWRQKGTGRARAGSSRSPLWRGGGIIFGPRLDRNFSRKINKKAKRQALFMVLSDRVANNALVILEKPVLENFKTKVFAAILNNLEEKVFKNFKTDEKKKAKNKNVRTAARSVIFINDTSDEKVTNSGRNLAGVKMINLDNINLVDLLNYRNVIFTDKAVDKLESVYNK
ncbi:MAG TPA: 50S ribosomal protein L4 [Candidatus Methylomirabilis sp.]|nr:50S ribosomal protein L4 [Candidatus Methylomirabilis sp.]